jgi:hypothetical protein
VEQVLQQREPLSKVVRILKIKLTTARTIITKYKRTGLFPMRDPKKKTLSLPKHQESSKSKD